MLESAREHAMGRGMKRAFFVFVCVSTLAVAGCGESAQQSTEQRAPPPVPAAPDEHAMLHAPASIAEWAKGAQLFEGLGSTHRKITTPSPEAQKYFDQGLRLLWAFNHDESTRSFARATELDPHCAICYWGVAFTVGPNYNMLMMAAPRATVAWEALKDAQRVAASATPAEQGLIAALAKRFTSDQPLDASNLTPLLVAYANGMKELAQRFPDDLDVQTLYAESLMNIHAWKLWTADGNPAEGTEEILATLESVLDREPNHPGANHYYVHAMEASPHPEKAVVEAERLRDMMPAAGHLVHMPAHIMQRVGRYEDAAEANRKGASADEVYYAKASALDYYPMYTAHNYQFLAASAAMEGRQAETLQAVAAMRKVVTDEMLLTWPGYDWMFMSEEYAAYLRFGRWDDMLAKPAPNPKLPALGGAYLFGRAVSLAAKGRIDEATSALSQLEHLNESIPADLPAGFNTAKDVFGIAIDVAKARIADTEGRIVDAITQLEDAVSREDKLAYDEPPDWFIPTRQLLGAELLKAGKPTEAEAVYRDDLKQHPENGWSLCGLAAALKRQQKTVESATVEQQFNAAWTKADLTIVSSAF
jgi:tetratricopeptide (TPR) repeat protein